MKKTILYMAGWALSGLILTACGVTSKMIVIKSRSERTDVFKEVAETGTIPVGYAGVIIKANIKTHPEGYFIMEPKDLHGRPGYPFVINIDEQAVIWKVNGEKDRKPVYGQKGETSRDPEAGDGMKYILQKTIRLAAGTHKVFFGLPEESYFMTFAITVHDGGFYVLELMPHYRYKTRPTRIPTFLKGVKTYEVSFKKIDAQVP